ncbi:MAG: hypothetical protein KatS3mg108_1535 [Isosphaeraceae bacterium]|jgi:hypothetical protein|nr:MAG: hypothetical protein KatS3mg108_1535 [Isosphaeraceae bacterium]
MASSRWFARRVVDPVNSVAWFAMDGLWLAHQPLPAYLATAAALTTGALLLTTNRRFGRRLKDDLALNAWMWMNALWLVSDLGENPALRLAALVVGGLGVALLVVALWPIPSRRHPLGHFRKLRLPHLPTRHDH